MPSRLTLVPGSQGPRHSGSVASAASAVLTATERVRTMICSQGDEMSLLVMGARRWRGGGAGVETGDSICWRETERRDCLIWEHSEVDNCEQESRTHSSRDEDALVCFHCLTPQKHSFISYTVIHSSDTQSFIHSSDSVCWNQKCCYFGPVANRGKKLKYCLHIKLVQPNLSLHDPRGLKRRYGPLRRVCDNVAATVNTSALKRL